MFDIVGAAAVAAWLSVIGYFVYDQYLVTKSEGVAAGAVFREGESYMLLTREEDEVGFIHEARTHVAETNSWLLEYDLMMNVSMLGIDQILATKIKATVDPSAVLREFSASISTAGTTFELQGEVAGNEVTMSMDLAGETRTQKIPLNEPPRLSNSALNELVANPNLEPGTRFEQEYFDPTTMGMTKMSFEYVRKHTVTVFEEEVPSFHFRQRVAGNELDVYVDQYGEVQLQEFPLRILGARLPEALGRARAQGLRSRFEAAQEKASTASAPNLSLEATMDLLRSGDLASAVPTTRYRLELPADVTFDLSSLEQRATAVSDGVVEIDTAERGEPEPAPADLAPLLARDLRVDADHESFGALLDPDAPQVTGLKAEMIARAVRKRMTAKAEIGIQTASAALAAGEGDCTEYALVLVAALRHHDIPARFVSGLRADEEGRWIAHQWVQYWDGERFVDVDPTNAAMIPGNRQLQLFTHLSPDKPELATVLDQLRVEPLVDKPAAPQPGDFN